LGPLCLLAILTACLAGCGTTRFTDTRRSATEQLLISGAIDRAVDTIDCNPLAGKTVYLDTNYYRPTEDLQYLLDTVRQKLLASDCILKNKKEDADLVVQMRVGTIGTDSNQVIFGVPASQVPQELAALSSSPLSVPSIPEIPIVKKQAQRGVAKIGLFAYDQKTGTAYWQSGALPVDATASEIWVIGAGPWQWGTIYDEPRFAGGDLPLAGLFRKLRRKEDATERPVGVADIATFQSPTTDLPAEEEPGKIQLAGHSESAEAPEQQKPPAAEQQKPPPAADKKPATLPESAAKEAKPIPAEKAEAEKQDAPKAEPAKKDAPKAEPEKKDAPATEPPKSE
jgi:hypothetical protein